MSAPARVCARGGCHRIVARGYCDEHRRTAARPQGAHGQGYTRQWQRFRAEEFPAMLAAIEKPVICGARLADGPSPHSRCATQGLMVTTDLHLDHEPPLETWERKDPSRVVDPHRVGFLCRACHSAKTLSELRYANR